MEFVKYEKKGHLVYVTINRPEVMNALHPPANDELSPAWDHFAADADAGSRSSPAAARRLSPPATTSSTAPSTAWPQ